MQHSVTYTMLFLWFISYSSCKSNIDKIEIYETINIDLDQQLDSIDASDFIKSVKYIPLETLPESIIENITSVQFCSNRIYINNSNSSVMIFDLDGNYINKIDRRGRGHGEYTDMYDFLVLNNQHVLVLCGHSLLEFDSNCDFIKKIELPFKATNIERNDKGQLVLRGGIERQYVTIWDIETEKVISSHFDFDLRYSSYIKSRSIWDHSDRICFMRNYDNKVYQLCDDSLTIRWNIDLGKYNIKEKDLVKDIFGGYMPTPNICPIYDFFETDKFCVLDLQADILGDYPYYVYYHKESKKIKIVTKEFFRDDLTYLTLPPSYVGQIDGKNLVRSISPERWKSELKLNKSNDRNWKKVNTYLQKIKEDSNPILLIYAIQ